MEMKELNHTLYTDLPIDELDRRLALEDLENKLELECIVVWCVGRND
jgi:hypothetical protein